MAKSIFITGASSGIGEALSEEFASRGYDLFLTARRFEVLEEIKGRIEAAHSERKVFVRALDVTDVNDVAAAIGEAAEALGRIDIVIANAGLGSGGPIGTGRLQSDTAVIETNVIGAMATIDAAVALFRKQGGGQVVGITSVSGFRGLPGSGSYSASKAALGVYLDSLRVETYKEPITVTELAPGFIDTPINQDNPRRPFLIDVQKGARIAADLIEKGVAHATVPRWPWTAMAPLIKRMPARVLARQVPSRR